MKRIKPTVEDYGLVIKRIAYRDNDLILHLLTRDQGKSSLFVSNGKKPHKRYGCSFELFSHLKFLYRNNLKETLAFIENKWKDIDKIHTYEYQFFDEQLANSHAIFGDLISIVGFISILAVSIACLGLLGMATYTAETRLKEIGIRKVMGASVKSILLLLSRGFIILLGIAILIGGPLAYFINNLWLELFAYRVNFGINIFGSAILIMLILGLLTVGSQTLRAALTNPSVTLRDE